MAEVPPDQREALWSSRAGVRLCVTTASAPRADAASHEGESRQARMFSYAVCAVPFDSLARLLPQTAASAPLRAQLAQFQTSPITGVHLWFER